MSYKGGRPPRFRNGVVRYGRNNIYCGLASLDHIEISMNLIFKSQFDNSSCRDSIITPREGPAERSQFWEEPAHAQKISEGKKVSAVRQE